MAEVANGLPAPGVAYEINIRERALGAKLRRAAALALLNNPDAKQPWTLPVAYSNSLAVRSGQVISNNGNWYVCIQAGTTAASGGGPTTSADARAITDGTAMFTYYSGARTADAGDGAPTITQVTTSPALGLNWYPVEGVDRYLVRGANPVAHSTSYWRLNAFDSKAGTTTTNGAAIAAMVEESKFAVFIPLGARVRIAVDGRYINPGNYSNAANSWVVIDFTGSSGRRARLVEYETDISSNNYFGFISTTATGAVYAPEPTEEVRGVWIGDSYQAGSAYGPFLSGAQMSACVAKRTGIRDMWGMGVGGTGYLATGASSFYTFRERLPQAVALNPDILFFMGSVNDKSSTALAITAEVTLTIEAARLAGHYGPIVIVGVPSLDTVGVMSPAGSGLTAAQIETAIFAGVTAAAEDDVFTVPIATDRVPWVTGSWNNSGLSAVNGTSLNKDYWLANDSVHPADHATAMYADRIDQVYRRVVLPAL